MTILALSMRASRTSGRADAHQQLLGSDDYIRCIPRTASCAGRSGVGCARPQGIPQERDRLRTRWALGTDVGTRQPAVGDGADRQAHYARRSRERKWTVAITIDEVSAPGGQDGLLGMALDIGNGYVYAAYTRRDQVKVNPTRSPMRTGLIVTSTQKVVRLSYD